MGHRMFDLGNLAVNNGFDQSTALQMLYSRVWIALPENIETFC